MLRKGLLLAGQSVKPQVLPTKHLSLALKPGVDKSLTTKAQAHHKQLKYLSYSWAVYHGQRSLVNSMRCQKLTSFLHHNQRANHTANHSGSADGTMVENSKKESSKTDSEVDETKQIDSEFKIVQKVSTMESFRLHVMLPTAILGSAGLIIAAFFTLECPLIILAACSPYFVRQCYLWTVDRPITITCDVKNKMCQLTHIGWYGLPIWNTLTLSKDDFKRIPNTVCLLGEQQAANVERSWMGQKEHNRITVFPGTEQEKRFLIDPNTLRGDPGVYHYFFCTSERCLKKDENVGKLCPAKPTSDNQDTLWK